MRVLAFNISGPLACFRKATTFEATTEFILTYDIMPITVLKGLVGAVMGYNGLAHAYRNNTQPEYIQKLEGVGIGIEPVNLGTKFYQKITNTTGFANSGETGGDTGIIKQEILSDVSYNIYLTDEFEDFDLLYDKLKNNRMTYPIVLGKKGFNAIISNVHIFNDNVTTGYEGVLSSIADASLIESLEDDLLDEGDMTYKYILDLPVSYDELMMYHYLKINYSDQSIAYDGEVISSKNIAILR